MKVDLNHVVVDIYFDSVTESLQGENSDFLGESVKEAVADLLKNNEEMLLDTIYAHISGAQEDEVADAGSHDPEDLADAAAALKVISKAKSKWFVTVNYPDY